MQLGQAEAFGVFHHHDGGFRHIHPHLDDGGGHQHPRAARGEVAQRGLAHIRLLPAVRQADLAGEALGQFGEAGLGGGGVHHLRFLDRRADPVAARALVQRPADAGDDLRRLAQPVQRGGDALPPRRFPGQPADRHLAPLGQQQRARNGGRGHHQHVRGLALLGQHQPLGDAEAVLLIHHGQGQVAEGDGVLEQRVGADHDLHGAFRQPAQHLLAFGALDAAGQHFHPHAGGVAQPHQGAQVLAGQDFGRRHDGGLAARLHRPQHGQHRHQGLAAADIALQQPQHAVGGGQVGVYLRQGGHLAGGGRKAEGGQRLGPQLPGAGQCLPRAVPNPPADQAQRQLPGQQLVIRQALAAQCQGFRPVRVLPAAQALGKAGPGFPPQQGGVVPFRQVHQVVKCQAHHLGHLAAMQPLGQRPFPLELGDHVGWLDIVGVGDGAAVAVHLQRAADLADAAHGQAALDPFRAVAEHRDGQHGRAGPGPHPYGLAARADPVVLQHLDLAGHRLAMQGVGRLPCQGAVGDLAGQVKQQVQHPAAAAAIGQRLA